MAKLVLPMLENFSHCLCSTTKASLSQAHAHILKNGISLPETIQIFSKLDHFGHVIRVFSYMLTQGIVPDSRVLPTVIKTCAALSALQTGKQMHCFALVSGFGLDSVVLSSLLHMYVQFDRLKDARNVFDKLPQPGVVTSSALISHFARKGRVKETMELFHQTRYLGVELNLVSWNGMISGFNRSGGYLDAVLMFRNMHLEGLKPDGTSVSSVLPAVGDLKMPLMGIQIHCYVNKQGLGPDKFVVSALIDMYGKCACASEMSGVFNEMDEVDVGACNALVTGLSRNGLVDNALEVFRQFKGMDLNVVSWTSMIASCSQNGKDIEALELFREMQIEGIKPNSHVLDVPPDDGNTPARASPPVAAPILNNVPPFGKPLSNQGQQSPLGYQQQQELNNPPQEINQPRSGLTRPLSSPNQPLSGTSVPFSALNQPFGASDSQNLLRNLPFASEVSAVRTSILGVVLFPLVTLMATL
ncbi:hypothetical protein SADUNF_Sadunf02G0018200 [Salix dunnii]|uniref:Pentatricopeptide repeat-containing protein n=1 Tax=Salix dunnii TaxID=1413687 RepID=A0A835TEZ3_9ROSI|nr:hypothetical protein SADUNF_Sadunf02G0018200 [Salix dunnii]